MEVYQVIFNDVPLPKENIMWETVYLPKQVIFRVNSYKELHEKINKYIYNTKIKFSSYEICLMN
jgi:hypothetical protein